jgi:hypothetical protein
VSENGNEFGNGPPSPGQPTTWGERIGKLCALIIVLMIFAAIAGFASDLIVWAWTLGRGIIH